MSDLVKEFSFNDGEVIRGMVLQGERHTYREPSFPEENKVLFTIPIRRKIVGKAVAILVGLRVLKDVEHPIRVVRFSRDLLDALTSDLLIAEAVNSGIDPDAVKELAAVIEMAANGNWIKDGDYFAFYWCPSWFAMDELDDEGDEERPVKGGTPKVPIPGLKAYLCELINRCYSELENLKAKLAESDEEEEEAEEAEEDDRDREIDFAELGQQLAEGREGYEDR